MKTSLIVVLLLGTSPVVNAYFLNGNDLAREMREWNSSNDKNPRANISDANNYLAYIKGVYDALEANQAICAPPRTKLGQVGAIVAKFLNENPERWAEPAVDLVAESLASAFPCKK